MENRNLLGCLLLSCEETNNCHTAIRCCKSDPPDLPNQDGFKSASDIHGAGAISCYAIGNNNPKHTFTTCAKQYHSDPNSIRYLQQYCFYLFNLYFILQPCIIVVLKCSMNCFISQYVVCLLLLFIPSTRQSSHLLYC